MNIYLRSARIASFFILCILLLGSTAFAGQASVKKYTLPDHSSLHLLIPADWEDSVSKKPHDQTTPVIKFSNKTGPVFTMYLTPYRARQILDGEQLRQIAQKTADHYAPQSVERKIGVAELKGTFCRGYYFLATDKEPKPGMYKYLTQGYVSVGQLLIEFSIFSNDGQEGFVADGLELLKSANQTSNSLVAIEMEKVDGELRLTVPLSKLALTIPGNDLTQVRNTMGGGADNPRYFFFQDEKRKVLISGWFESAKSFPGLREHWEKKESAWKKNKVPAAQNVSFLKKSNWDIVAYDHSLPADGCNSHISAHWVQEETWIDVHVSTSANSQCEQNRNYLLSVLETFKVTVKK